MFIVVQGLLSPLLIIQGYTSQEVAGGSLLITQGYGGE
jgi:hypothetical protein